VIGSPTQLLTPGRLGPMETRNRIVRSGTSESVGGPGGAPTEALVALHERILRARDPPHLGTPSAQRSLIETPEVLGSDVCVDSRSVAAGHR
jgi:hypothetical protein